MSRHCTLKEWIEKYDSLTDDELVYINGIICGINYRNLAEADAD